MCRVLKVDVHDPFATLVVPEGLKSHEVLRLNMYTAGIRQITKSPTKFTDGMKCAVCHKPHSFEKCPILLNIPLLKKHFIAYCLAMNRTQNQMVASIQKIDATWGNDDNDDDNDDDDDDNDDHHDDNNDPDFQGEEE